MSNAGGAATTGGIDFQHRIGSIAVIQLFLESDIFPEMIAPKGEKLLSVRFETNDSIDDIVVSTEKGSIFYQAKRSINLSDDLESEYSSVIRQFVRQYIRSHNTSDQYTLITSPKASGKIIRELKKLTESARLNRTGYEQDPKTISEQDVLDKTFTLISCHYDDIQKQPLTSIIAKEIFRMIHVRVLDVEENGTDERCLLGLLSSFVNIDPNLFWNTCITKVITMAKKRQSIDIQGAKTTFINYRSIAPANGADNPLNGYIEHVITGNISSEKEVILVQSSNTTTSGQDIFIFESRRFSESGARILEFNGNSVKFQEGSEFTLMARASTLTGISRYISENEGVFKDANIVFAVPPDEMREYISTFSEAHSAMSKSRLEHATEVFKCLECGEAISENGAYLIEIDEIGKQFETGLTHMACLKPSHRILGKIDSELFKSNQGVFTDFNYNLWFSSLHKGQGLMGGVNHLLGRIIHVGWKSVPPASGKGDWSIKIELENGSAMYAFDRGKTLRLPKSKADDYTRKMNEIFEIKRAETDPYCYSSISSSFGPYSVVAKVLAKGELVSNCISAETVKFSRDIDLAYSQFTNFYAPLIALIDAESDEPISLLGSAVLLSNPMNIEQYFDNWRRSKFEISNVKTMILESDEQFDRFLASLPVEEGACLAFIDPLIDAQYRPVGGIAIFRYEDVVTHTGAISD